MAHMAFHNSLTDLPNRSAFLQALDQMIDACADTNDEFSVLSINLDRFKEINDVFGHARGDGHCSSKSGKCLQEKACNGAVIARGSAAMNSA